MYGGTYAYIRDQDYLFGTKLLLALARAYFGWLSMWDAANHLARETCECRQKIPLQNSILAILHVIQLAAGGLFSMYIWFGVSGTCCAGYRRGTLAMSLTIFVHSDESLHEINQRRSSTVDQSAM